VIVIAWRLITFWFMWARVVWVVAVACADRVATLVLLPQLAQFVGTV
jgi:hypothetical protein